MCPICLPPVFVNQLLLEYSRIICLYIACDSFHITVVELMVATKIICPKSLKYLLSYPLLKMFADPLLIFFILDNYSFLIWAFKALPFPLGTDLAVFHKFLYVVFIFILHFFWLYDFFSDLQISEVHFEIDICSVNIIPWDPSKLY